MKSNQKTRIINYISTYKSITPLEAFRDLGIERLAARVHDLKAEGWPIVKESTRVKNRFGEECTVAKYKLEGLS